MHTKFYKSDLPFRCVVELRNGNRYLRENEKLSNDSGFNLLSGYTDDLKARCAGIDIPQYDIVKVFESATLPSILSVNKDHSYNYTLLWERKSGVREMTLSEIEDELGYQIILVSHH